MAKGYGFPFAMNDFENELNPLAGYLELGMVEEAWQEWENLPRTVQNHPMGLLARLELLIEEERWAEGAAFGKTLCEQWPEDTVFFLKTAFCWHELKETRLARETLLFGPAALKSQALYYYNLACYETQLGNLEEGRRLLQQSFRLDKGFKEEAGEDVDLRPLWGAEFEPGFGEK
jgi:tetratricopeptide (TPR) repeat protein